MVTTGAGVKVGGVVGCGYDYLIGRVNEVMRRIEMRNMEFLGLLNEPASTK